jgi:hypothetical protein
MFSFPNLRPNRATLQKSRMRYRHLYYLSLSGLPIRGHGLENCRLFFRERDWPWIEINWPSLE